MDRDVVAAINLSRRGRLRFDRSRTPRESQGGAVEAVKRNPTPTDINRVDALKSASSMMMAPAAAPAAPSAEGKKKEEKPAEDDKKKEEEALAGLGALFG